MGWQHGTGLGKHGDGMSRPLAVRRRMQSSVALFDLTHYSSLYSKALTTTAADSAHEQPAVVAGGMFVAASQPTTAVVEEPHKAVNANELFVLCGGRTARRTNRKHAEKLVLEARDKERSAEKDEEETKREKKKHKKDKKKRKKKEDKKEKKKKRKREGEEKSE